METRPSAFKSALLPGVVIGICSILITLVGFILISNMQFQKIFDWSFWIAFVIIGRYYAVDYRKKYLNNEMTYGKALVFLLIISLIYLIIYALFFYAYINWIFPEYVNKLIELTQEGYAKWGISDDKIEEMTSQFTTNKIFFGDITNGVIGSVFFSLITAIFARRKSNPFNSDNLI